MSELSVERAQRELRNAFVGGGPGMLISGAFWLCAALVATQRGIAPAFTTLFVSGIFIFPLTALVCRFVFKRRAPDHANPIGRIALESTIAMISGLVVASLLLPLRPDWVFPIAAIAVGSHFFAFRSAYGDASFWLLGALLTALGASELFGMTNLDQSLLFLFAAIEIAFGVWLTRREWTPSLTPSQP